MRKLYARFVSRSPNGVLRTSVAGRRVGSNLPLDPGAHLCCVVRVLFLVWRGSCVIDTATGHADLIPPRGMTKLCERPYTRGPPRTDVSPDEEDRTTVLRRSRIRPSIRTQTMACWCHIRGGRSTYRNWRARSPPAGDGRASTDESPPPSDRPRLVARPCLTSQGTAHARWRASGSGHLRAGRRPWPDNPQP